MIRAEFFSKFILGNHKLDKLKNFIDNVNNKMKAYDIPEDEYFFYEGIKDEY